MARATYFPVSSRVYPGPFWRLWSVWRGETVLRAPYLGAPWPSVKMVACCECPDSFNPSPRHGNPFDPACARGVAAFANRRDAEIDGCKLTAINLAHKRPEIETIILGVVELHGTLMIGLNAPGGRNIPTLTANGAPELVGRDGGTIKRLVVVQDWCAGKDSDAIVSTLRTAYPRVRVESAPHNPAMADTVAMLASAYSAERRG